MQVADGLLLVNHEQFRGGDPYSAGMAVYDLADPFDPQQVGWFDSTGKGVHRIVWTGGRYAYVSAIPEGFDDRIWVIVDMADPRNPVEAGRWWWPGQWVGGRAARPGPRASATPRTTPWSTATAPTSATATPAWSCSTSPTSPKPTAARPT